MYTGQEEGGIFGICNSPDAAVTAVLGLHALQHRGHHTYGLAASNFGKIHSQRGFGLVSEQLTDPNTLAQLPGTTCIGQVRFARSEARGVSNIQPAQIDCSFGQLALVLNGHISNEARLRETLQEWGGMVSPKSEAELLLYLLAHAKKTTLEKSIFYVLGLVEGGFSLLLLSKDLIIAARDPRGYRPLLRGAISGGTCQVFASETCALDLVAAEYTGEVNPGEIAVVKTDLTYTNHIYHALSVPQYCTFELARLARPDSFCSGYTAGSFRRKVGRQLAIEHPADADVVIPIPDAANEAAQGFAEQLAIGCNLLGIIRNQYMTPPGSKKFAHKMRYNIQRDCVKDRRVVIVFSHLFSGGSCKEMVRRLGDEGKAKEVHVRIVFPPTLYECARGVEITKTSQLLANTQSQTEMLTSLNATSLGFTSVSGLQQVLGANKESFCYDCISSQP